MATKKKKQEKNKKIKNIAKILVPIIAIILFVYIIYKFVNLIVVPTDIVVIENGTIYNEESAVRVCNKR